MCQSIFCRTVMLMILGGLTGISSSRADDAPTPSPNQLLNLATVPNTHRNKITREKQWPQAIGEMTVCTWKDDKIAAVSITIDDNTKPDHAWWIEQGQKYDMRFTWFAVTNGISGKNAGFNGTWEDFQKLVDAGHDVQSHAATHRSKSANWPADKDYSVSIEQLSQHLKGTKPLTLAYPGGGLANDPNAAATMFAGARGTRGTVNGPSPDYLDVHSTSGSRAFDIPAGEKGDFASLRAQLEPADGKGPKPCWYCVHYHGVQYNTKWREEVQPHVIRLLDYLKENRDKVWVGLFREIVLYGQERDTAKLNVTSSTSDRIVFELSDRMLDDWYDMPLTIKVRLPDTWENVTAQQRDQSINSRLITFENHRYALVDAVPDRGQIVLTPAGK